MSRYPFKEIEAKWQRIWEERGTFAAPARADPPEVLRARDVPVSVGPLHMGHVRNYTIGDVLARYQRMQGNDVLQPMGWDAFGLPAENAAIKNVHPAKWTYANIAHMRAQFKSMGLRSTGRASSPPATRTTTPEAAMFLRILEKGIAYRKDPGSTGIRSTRPCSPTSR